MSTPLKTLALAAAFAAGMAPMAQAATLSDDARAALEAGLADEYHAEAFYAAVMDKFGEIRPFVNIIRAEQTHSGAIADVMETYGLTVPANTQLNDPAVVASVPATISEACAIGVDAEMVNRTLYNEQLIPAVADYPDIKVVFENLRDASEYNHLPAFQRCAAR